MNLPVSFMIPEKMWKLLIISKAKKGATDMKNDRIKKFMILAGFALMLSACKKEPTWQEQYDFGMKYLEEGNFEEAITALDAAIKIEPARADLYIARGDAYVGLQDREAAEKDYRKAMELDRSDSESYNRLADLLLENDELDEAGDVIEKGLEEIPDDKELQDKQEQLKQQEEEAEKSDTAWAEEIYTALENNDFESVGQIMQEDGFLEKCKPWVQKDWAYWADEEAYWIKFADGRSLGVVVEWPHDGNRPHIGEEDRVHYSDQFSELYELEIMIVPEVVKYEFTDTICGYPGITYRSYNGFITWEYWDGKTVRSYINDEPQEDYTPNAETGEIVGTWHA